MNLLDSQRDRRGWCWCCVRGFCSKQSKLTLKKTQSGIRKKREKKQHRAYTHPPHSINSLTNMKMQAISTRDAALVFFCFSLLFIWIYLYSGWSEKSTHTHTITEIRRFVCMASTLGWGMAGVRYEKEIKTINIKTNMSFPPYCLWKQKSIQVD